MDKIEICRLCLTPVLAYCSLLQNNAPKIIESLTSIKIDENDNFPKYSCIKCWLNTKLAYKIQQSIVESDNKLREQAVYTNTEESIVIKEEPLFNNNLTLEDNLRVENYSNDPTQVLEWRENCPICGLNVESDEASAHLKTHFNNLEQNCDVCNKVFNNTVLYRQHLCSCGKNKEKLTCKTCKLTFHYQSLYDIHNKNAHNLVSLKNEHLPKPNVILRSRINCRVKQTKKRPIKTQKTGLNNKSKNDASSSISNHGTGIGKGPLESQNKIAEEDEIVRDEHGNLKCLDCSKSFPTRKQMRAHVASHRRKNCPICNADITAINLSRHIEDHKSEPVVCHICGTVAKNYSSLRGHIFYTHSNRLFKCDLCGKQYKKRYTRDLHIKKEHTGEKSCVCDTCGKSFFTQYSLSKHVKMTHLKQRPHICSFCKKGFSSKFALLTHIRQHTNEAPYKCSVCGEGFRQNVSLRSHKKSKHKIDEVKTVPCEHCGKMFSSTWALKVHGRLHM